MEYPEHEKLGEIKHLSQAVGDFIEWLGANGFAICEHMERRDEWVRIHKSRDQLLAEHFEIDLNKLEEEKVAMLEQLRASSAKTI